MACAAELNICIIEGESYGETFYIDDENGDRIDLAGYVMNMHIKATLDGAVLLDLASTDVLPDTSRIEITTGAASDWTIIFDPSELMPGTYIYSLLVTEPGGRRETWFKGEIEIRPGATVV